MNDKQSIDDEVSLWLEELKSGDRDNASRLFDRYFSRLVGLAASRLRGRPELVGYEEDIALSAFKSLCLGAEKGRFPRLVNRDELWRLLAVITIRKALNIQRRKRLAQNNNEDIIEVLSRDPSPEEVVQMSDQIEMLLGQLDSDEHRRIALLKVEGRTNEEIAAQLGCVVRTIERKLHQIRVTWNEV